MTEPSADAVDAAARALVEHVVTEPGSDVDWDEARCCARAALAAALPIEQAALRQTIADEIRQKIDDWEPTCSDRYIRGMRAALLYVTGEAHEPLFGAKS